MCLLHHSHPGNVNECHSLYMCCVCKFMNMKRAMKFVLYTGMCGHATYILIIFNFANAVILFAMLYC